MKFPFFLNFRKSLGDRLTVTAGSDTTTNRIGNTQMSFSIDRKAKYRKQQEKDLAKHRDERKRVVRPIKSLHLKKYVPKT